MLIYIGLDDTDNATSRGTGRLARVIAENLADDFHLLGVTRHQLLFDKRIPYTSHNSSACILLDAANNVDLSTVWVRVSDLMQADFQPGSDPGLCVASEVPQMVCEFGRTAQREVVNQSSARNLAAQHGILLAGLGGSQDGVIGALAAVGLAATGEDGRYIWVGQSREISGLQPVEVLLQAGITRVCDEMGLPVNEGLVLADKCRPARRGGQPVQFVGWQDDHWFPLKLD